MAIINSTIRDRAYIIATGHHLTVELTYQEFQDIKEDDLMDVLWQPIEYWDYGTVTEHIAGIAEAIISSVSPEQLKKELEL